MRGPGTELVDMEMVQFLPLAFPIQVARGTQYWMCSFFGSGSSLQRLGERYMEKYDPKRMEFATGT